LQRREVGTLARALTPSIVVSVSAIASKPPPNGAVITDPFKNLPNNSTDFCNKIFQQLTIQLGGKS
jgi:hypothetical protein